MTKVEQSKPEFSRGRGFASWLLQRVSGLILAVCLIAHAISVHFLRSTSIDASFVHDRLSQGVGIVGFYAAFIATLVYHAMNGLWAIVLDYRPSTFARRIVGGAFWLAGIALTVWAVLILRAFLALK